MIKKLLKNQRGLTLIELLAVIVILGIIAAIAVPSIGNIIDNTEDKAIVSEAIQIINAAKIVSSTDTDATIFVHKDETTGEINISDYVENVENEDYTITRNANGDYSISDHPSVGLANSAANATSATEEQLINYTN
ncbi:type II secretion system protein [Metabacillus herbersteinensis]|uniref:Type II secretion system protein n=1 Tax=Metabacillus herbersteinensis TaxID=283816 RepID=A0ABV6G907_9BACI